jgi:hypothetical protein
MQFQINWPNAELLQDDPSSPFATIPPKENPAEQGLGRNHRLMACQGGNAGGRQFATL